MSTIVKFIPLNLDTKPDDENMAPMEIEIDDDRRTFYIEVGDRTIDEIREDIENLREELLKK